MTNHIKTGDISGQPARDAPGSGKGASRAEAELLREDFRGALREGRDKANGEQSSTLGGKGANAPGGKDALLQDKLRDKLPDEAPQDKLRDKLPGEAPPAFSGDALLRGLGASYAPLEAAPASGMTLDASSLAAELAESILVNTENRAEGEVRISLKQGVLPDTEIILRREGDLLLVQIVSGNASSLETLRAARQNLQDRLAGLGLEVSVDLRDSRDDSNAGSGRSRGLDYLEQMNNEE